MMLLGFVLTESLLIIAYTQERSKERISFIRNSLLTQLKDSLCPSCRLFNRTVTDEELSCRERADQVVFRARIIGNSQYSASGLINLLQSWVMSGTASVSVNSIRYHIDPTCSTALDSLTAPDCAIFGTASAPSTTSLSPAVSLSSITGISGGEIGGIIIGAVIVVLLLFFIALVAWLIYRTFRSTRG